MNIRTSTGKINRPVARLYPLEINATQTPSVSSDTTRQTTTVEIQPPRSVRQAAIKGKEKIKEWTHIICGPPEDVTD